MALDRSYSPNEVQAAEVDDEGLRDLRKRYTQMSFSAEAETDEKVSEKDRASTRISDAESIETESIVANTEEIALKALHVDDDPSLNPWTFRVFFLGWSASFSA